MCGRYTLTRSGRRVRDTFELDEIPAIEPRYNIAPTQESLVVRAAGAGRDASRATWGFGAGSGERLMINARAETVTEKPAFRDSFARRRCLVPADGFYEWRRERGNSLPFLFTAADRALLAFGGLWKPTLDEDAAPGAVFTILTVAANELVAEVHPRMPLILPTAAWPAWLGEESGRTDLEELLEPFPAADMAMREVSTAVNKVSCDSPACWDPPEPPGAVQLDLLT